MPRKTGRGARKASGVAKASKAAATRARKAERAIRAGEPPPKRTTAEEIALAERRLEALQYAEAGHTYRDIGGWLDPPCGPGQAYRLVKEALAELQAETAEAANHVRAMQLQQLSTMLVKPLENAVKGDTQSVQAVLKIMERQAALVGADAPQRQEHTGKDGQPIQQAVTIRRVVVAVPARREPVGDA
jgi:hypothetical protein